MATRSIPAYDKVKAFVRQRIASGRWRPGDPVPSEAELMQRFGSSRMTVNRAMRELVSEGLVRRVRGSGSFVAELSRISSRLEIRDIREEVTGRGHAYACEVLSVRRVRASASVAQELGLPTGSTVFHSLLVHLEGATPILHEDRYVNPAAAPHYVDEDFTRTTPTAHLIRHAPLTEARFSIEAVLPTAQEALRLRMPRSEPCLAVVRCTVSGPRVASIARLLYPGSRHRLASRFQA